MSITSRTLADGRTQVSMTVQNRLNNRDFSGSLEVTTDPHRQTKDATYTLLVDGKPALTKRLSFQAGKGGRVSVDFGHTFKGVKQMIFDVRAYQTGKTEMLAITASIDGHLMKPVSLQAPSPVTSRMPRTLDEVQKHFKPVTVAIEPQEVGLTFEDYFVDPIMLDVEGAMHRAMEEFVRKMMDEVKPGEGDDGSACYAALSSVCIAAGVACVAACTLLGGPTAPILLMPCITACIAVQVTCITKAALYCKFSGKPGKPA